MISASGNQDIFYLGALIWIQLPTFEKSSHNMPNPQHNIKIAIHNCHWNTVSSAIIYIGSGTNCVHSPHDDGEGLVPGVLLVPL